MFSELLPYYQIDYITQHTVMQDVLLKFAENTCRIDCSFVLRVSEYLSCADICQALFLREAAAQNFDGAHIVFNVAACISCVPHT